MHAPILFNSAAVLTIGELQASIHQVLNDKFTGQVQVNFQMGKTLTLFIQDGHASQLYMRNHRIPDLKWESPLTMYGEGICAIQPAPARALMFRKIVLEELNPVKPQMVGANQLKSMFDLAERSPFPTLFYIQWEAAEAFVLLAGRNILLRRAIIITPVGAEEGLLALDQILTRDEPQCKVTIYHGDIKNQAWLEVHLNIMLEWYCQKILKHYGQLTGTVMVRSMLHSLSVLAEKRGWSISIEDLQLRDTSLFATATEAGAAYREIFSAMRSRIEPIIGSSLTRSLMKQPVDSTRDIYKVIQEVFGLIEETS